MMSIAEMKSQARIRPLTNLRHSEPANDVIGTTILQLRMDSNGSERLLLFGFWPVLFTFHLWIQANYFLENR